MGEVERGLGGGATVTLGIGTCVSSFSSFSSFSFSSSLEESVCRGESKVDSSCEVVVDVNWTAGAGLRGVRGVAGRGGARGEGGVVFVTGESRGEVEGDVALSCEFCDDVSDSSRGEVMGDASMRGDSVGDDHTVASSSHPFSSISLRWNNLLFRAKLRRVNTPGTRCGNELLRRSFSPCAFSTSFCAC